MMLQNYLIKFAKFIIPLRYHERAAEIYQDRENICLALHLIGIKHHCPCCGWYLRKLLSYGIKPRANALCPRCGSLERHRLLWLYLKHKTNIFTDYLRVLHFAPEPILQRKLKLLNNLDYITADLNPTEAMVQMDITEIQLGDNSINAILCNHVLEHVIDDRKAMNELFRVLKPGGWAILQVPILRQETFEDFDIITPEDRERTFGQKDHVRVYGKDYKDRLERVGFSVKVDSFVRTLDKSKIKRYGLLENENIYFCTKSGQL